MARLELQFELRAPRRFKSRPARWYASESVLYTDNQQSVLFSSMERDYKDAEHITIPETSLVHTATPDRFCLDR